MYIYIQTYTVRFIFTSLYKHTCIQIHNYKCECISELHHESDVDAVGPSKKKRESDL